ncbi:MAG: hypothetical protein JJE25_10260 [Bacteroidia bacterium]|nr:hypothetical protein [Bacteroidia bacterium]
MRKISERKVSFIILGILFVLFTVISVLSEGVYGGADNYVHYRIARYAFRHPEFFLDQWGKPVFTTIASLFAQYGFIGIKVFNILTGLLTAYFIFRIAQKLNYRFPLLVIIILCSMPMYFILMISSLTEILLSFVIIFSAWLFLNKKYFWFAVVASFLPFARTEGFFLLPVFALPLLYEKKFRTIPFLLTATIFYSIIGSFAYHDLFWIINQMPYIGGDNVYGSGSLFHFVTSYKELTGLLPALLLVTGTGVLIFQSVKENKSNNFSDYEWLLIFLPFFFYFAMHSFLWWRGLGSSLGLTRVIAGVLPCAALLCLRGWNFIYELLPDKKYIRLSLLSVLLFLLMREPFKRNRIPYPLSGTEEIVNESSKWLSQSEYFRNKIYYNDPTFCFFLDINPYDSSRIKEHVPDREHPESGIGEGEIVLWDAHFSPNEGGLPLDRMTDNSHFTLLKKFEPAETFQVLGGYNFAVYVFRKND